ncbi:MAG: integrase [Thermus sp.]
MGLTQEALGSSLREAYARYLRLEKGHTERGVRRYLQDLAYWERFLKERGLGAHREAVRRFLAERGFSPRRTQGFLAALRGYYRWLKEVWGLEVEDPTEGVARPRSGRRLPLYPTPEEVGRFVQGAEGEKEEALLKALALFLYGTGLRISEALSLKTSNLLWEEGKPVGLRVIGKRDKERLVPLSPIAQEALEAWLSVRGRGSGAIFGLLHTYPRAKKGKPPSAAYVEARFRAMALRMGLDPKRFTPHKLRHAYATALVEAGVDLSVVKDLLGRESFRCSPSGEATQL